MTIQAAAHVRDPDKYYNRTVQEWHRVTCPDDWVAIDIDLFGYCKRCYQGLYLIEAAEIQSKPTGVIANLAMRSAIPAVLIVHEGDRITRWRRIKPDQSDWFGEPRLREYLSYVRRSHLIVNHA